MKFQGSVSWYVTYNDDALGRLTYVRENGTTLLAQYGFDALSRRVSAGFTNGSSTSYDFDPGDNDLNRIDHAFSGSSAAFDYTYNQVNERTSLTVSDDLYLWRPASASSTAYTPNTLNQSSAVGGTTLSYDGNGNFTGDGVNTFTFDADNRLTGASNPLSTATYQYDALDRRTAKTVNGTTTQFLLDGLLEIAEYDGTGALLRRYVYGLGMAPVAEVSATGTRRFLHADAVGSVVAVTDTAGMVAERHGYGPYGEGASATGVAFRFTGHRYDPETGLYYMRARYYSASLGRFLSPDPIGYGDGPNLYRYAGNSPVSFFDPMGLFKTIAAGEGNPGHKILTQSSSTPPNQLGPTNNFLSFRVGPNLNIRAPATSANLPFDQIVPNNQLNSQAPPWLLNRTIITSNVNPATADVTIEIPDNYMVSLADNGRGFRIHPPAQMQNNENEVRIMMPTPQYPNGYIRYYNQAGQPMSPYSGRTGSKAQTHYPFDFQIFLQQLHQHLFHGP